MALKDWVKEEGMESPGWYNIKFFKEKGKLTKIVEIILSAGGDDEGSNNPNVEWIVGFYDSLGQPEGKQKTFKNKKLALAYAKSYMRTH
jgi:hypothetical protein